MVTHGPPWSDVPAPGPELPAEALTEMPAWTASRNASSTGSLYGCAPPEIEKLMTSTPSMIACSMAVDRIGAEAAVCQADPVLDHARAGGDAADRTALDAVEDRRGDAVAGGRRRGVGAVAVGVTRRADAGVLVTELVCAGPVDGHVGGGHGVGADDLVVARERRAERRVGAVAELASAQPTSGRAEAAGGEHRVLWPDARVDDAHDHVAAGLGRSTEGRPDGLGADEGGVVVERMLQRVLLDRYDARRIEERADLIRGDGRLDAAVRGGVRGPDLQARDRRLGARRDRAREIARVRLVGADGGRVLLELLAGHARARRGQPGDAAVVGRCRVVVVLDHDLDRRRVLPAQKGRVALGDRTRSGLRRRVGRVGRERRCREPRWVGADGDAGKHQLPSQQAQHGHHDDASLHRNPPRNRSARRGFGSAGTSWDAAAWTCAQ